MTKPKYVMDALSRLSQDIGSPAAWSLAARAQHAVLKLEGATGSTVAPVTVRWRGESCPPATHAVDFAPRRTAGEVQQHSPSRKEADAPAHACKPVHTAEI